MATALSQSNCRNLTARSIILSRMQFKEYILFLKLRIVWIDFFPLNWHKHYRLFVSLSKYCSFHSLFYSQLTAHRSKANKLKLPKSKLHCYGVFLKKSSKVFFHGIVFSMPSCIWECKRGRGVQTSLCLPAVHAWMIIIKLKEFIIYRALSLAWSEAPCFFITTRQCLDENRVWFIKD